MTIRESVKVVAGPQSQIREDIGAGSVEPGLVQPMHLSTPPWHRWGLPTWLVAFVIYTGWFMLTYHAAALPWWLLLPAGGWLVCWYGSLQHETVHGHPTRSDRINAAVAWLPLGLWMPFAIYRETHLEHHECPSLTDPFQDTESFYLPLYEWQRMGPVRRAILRFNNSLLGRLTVGPALVALTHGKTELRQLLSGDMFHAGIWVRHGLGVGLVLSWVVLVCDLSVWAYIGLFAYPGLSLTLMRSYAEHQPSANAEQRTAMVIGSPVTRLLYLNNNLHAVHHSHPELPWYAIPAEFCARRDAYTSQPGGHVYAGYTTILRRFLFQTRDHPVHPEQRIAVHRGVNP